MMSTFQTFISLLIPCRIHEDRFLRHVVCGRHHKHGDWAAQTHVDEHLSTPLKYTELSI